AFCIPGAKAEMLENGKPPQAVCRFGLRGFRENRGRTRGFKEAFVLRDSHYKGFLFDINI
ncbi:MAG: hypothetical protein Q4B69_02995, partial [Slackia sp.]|nr:hypothetical protein [Slackia sp.]